MVVLAEVQLLAVVAPVARVEGFCPVPAEESQDVRWSALACMKASSVFLFV
jgi:hypothetical protein